MTPDSRKDNHMENRRVGEFYPFLTHVEELALMWQEFRLGGFKQALMDTISKASRIQRIKLARAYAEEVEAVIRFEYDEGWWEAIQEKLKRDRLGYDDSQTQVEI